jgi:hypothetical protein
MKKTFSKVTSISGISLLSMDMRPTRSSRDPIVPALRANGIFSCIRRRSALLGFMFTYFSYIEPKKGNNKNLKEVDLPLSKEVVSYDLSKPKRYLSSFSLTVS